MHSQLVYADLQMRASALCMRIGTVHRLPAALKKYGLKHCQSDPDEVEVMCVIISVARIVYCICM